MEMTHYATREDLAQLETRVVERIGSLSRLGRTCGIGTGAASEHWRDVWASSQHAAVGGHGPGILG